MESVKISLSQRCSGSFTRRDWQNGEDYYRAGYVVAEDEGENWVSALVQGSSDRPYEVVIDWTDAEDGYLAVDCSCPRFADRALCKHVAATIMAMDASGVYAPGRKKLQVVALDEASIISPDDPNEDEWEFEPRDHRGASTSLISPNRKRPKADPPWKTALSQIDAAQATVIQHRRSAPTGGAQRNGQLWFVLDLEKSRAGGLPYVGFRQRKRKKDGSFGRLQLVTLSRQTILSMPLGEDRDLATLVLGGRADFSGYYAGVDYYDTMPNHGALLGEGTLEFSVRRLCESGRFGTVPPADASPVDEFVPLVWDDGPAWIFKVTAAKSENGKRWRIDGRLHRGDQSIDLLTPRLILAAGILIFRRSNRSLGGG